MTAPVISVLPDAPQRGVDSQEVFTSKANALVDSLATLVSETNTMGTWMNTTASEVDSDRIASAASATAAASSSSSASSSATTAITKASEASSSATSASSSGVVASTAATTATTKASEASSSASSASSSAATATTKASEASASAASASGSASTSSTQASIAIQKATEAGNSANSAAASAANAALSLGDYRGDYYAPTSYIAGQSVSYNGSIYIAKQGTTGNLPTNTTYWFKGTGAAAVYDVTASPTDTTAGRLLKVGDFGTGVRISTSGVVDWDSLTTEGSYFVQAVVGNTNAPWGDEAYSGYLEVKGTISLVYQTAWIIRSEDPQMYTRIFNGTTWSVWKEMVRVGDHIEQLDVDGTNVKYEAPIKPTLDLDFANQEFTVYSKTEGFVKKPLADIVSQGRGTAGSSVDAIGGITEFAAGENRFTFDGETGEALGYLSEESRTNLLTYSEFPNGLSDAPNRGGLVTLDSMDIGNGAVNAIAFGYDGSTPSFALKTNFTPVIGGTYVLSVIVEMDDGLPPSFESSNFNSNQNDFAMYSAGTPSGADPRTYTVSRMYNNTYKVSAVKTTPVDIAAFGVYRYATNSPRTFKVTGFQLEVGNFPTSYIKTLGTAVTRSADSMTRTLGQEWNPNEGTFVVNANFLATGNFTSGIYAFSDGSILNRIAIYFDPTSAVLNNIYVYITKLGGTSYVLTSSISSVGTGFHRVVISFNDSHLKLAIDGESIGEIEHGGLPSCTELSGITQGLGLNTETKLVTYYPRAFDAATIQRLSRI